MIAKKRKAVTKKRKPVVHRTPATGELPKQGHKRTASVNRETAAKKPPRETFMAAKGDSDYDNPTMVPTQGYKVNDFIAATKNIGDSGGWELTHISTGFRLGGPGYKSANRALTVGRMIDELKLPWHRITKDNLHKVISKKKREKVLELLYYYED